MNFKYILKIELAEFSYGLAIVKEGNKNRTTRYTFIHSLPQKMNG